MEKLFVNKLFFKHSNIDLLDKNSIVIYSFWIKNLSKPLYIGQTNNFRRRMMEYWRGSHNDLLNSYIRIRKIRENMVIKYFFCEEKI